MIAVALVTMTSTAISNLKIIGNPRRADSCHPGMDAAGARASTTAPSTCLAPRHRLHGVGVDTTSRLIKQALDRQKDGPEPATKTSGPRDVPCSAGRAKVRAGRSSKFGANTRTAGAPRGAMRPCRRPWAQCTAIATRALFWAYGIAGNRPRRPSGAALRSRWRDASSKKLVGPTVSDTTGHRACRRRRRFAGWAWASGRNRLRAVPVGSTPAPPHSACSRTGSGLTCRLTPPDGHHARAARACVRELATSGFLHA